MAGDTIGDFLHPKLTWKFLLRLAAVALTAYLIFGYLLIPCIIHGGSMEPTYASTGFNFCWRGAFFFDKPKIGDVVVVKYEDRVFYLKRVVGMPGDTISFYEGKLYRNGQQVEEPYVKLPSDWNLPPRHVEKGHYYVVGDNRSMDIDIHQFGQVAAKRIIGAPLW
ncbi:signal peptidase I [Victivallis sp. Marseille-Q1083]|mgnify:CR=1 FL=1|uniref:signal peptidase I n=1 Tax=Victivallis sp. Marseille-Q1083 TaxID=2717288 RepID=UPI00158D05B3|nr:signal peptidase I [Victivallis sp. Marseille-Q1083]